MNIVPTFFYRFSDDPAYCNKEFKSMFLYLTISLCCFIPTPLSTIKNKLNNMCCFQFNPAIMPPQEQGKSVLNITMPVKYILNKNSIVKEIYKPYNLSEGIVSVAANNISNNGSV